MISNVRHRNNIARVISPAILPIPDGSIEKSDRACLLRFFIFSFFSTMDGYLDFNTVFYNFCQNRNNERELFDVMVTEAYNKHGVCMDFYVTSYDKNYDKIWGEDNDRRYVRRFEVMAFFNLPREERLWSKFGIEGMDSFSMYVSKRHFWEASQYDDLQTNASSFAPYIPKVGDYIYSKFNKYIYEITEVKDEIMMNLLSKQHVWEFLVKPFKDEKIATSNLTSAASIADYTNKSTDKFDVTNTIDNKKDDVNYNPPATECGSGDPFSGW